MKDNRKRLTIVIEPNDTMVLPDRVGMMSGLLEQMARLTFPMAKVEEVVQVDVQRINGSVLYQQTVVIR